MRGLQIQLNSHWDRRYSPKQVAVPLSPVLRQELQWWRCPDNLLAGQPLLTPVPEVVMFTDASMEGWGATLQDTHVWGTWSEEDKWDHINLLELKAVHYGLQALQQEISGKTVGVLADNTTALFYLKNG